MRNVAWVFIVVGTWCMPSSVGAADTTPAQERAILDKALRLAGPYVDAHLRLFLVSELPRIVSARAEAWTQFDEDDKGDRIFVYTRSRTFLCAIIPGRDQNRCLLKVASVIVHEAWHLRNGRGEVGAYDAQLIFLQSQEASAFLQVNEGIAVDMLEVRRARDRAVANQRDAKRRSASRSGASGAPPVP
jgi:hypothetical protein